MLSKLLLLLQATSVVAFPQIAELVQKQALEKRAGIPATVPFPEYPGLPQHALFNKFDATAQLIDVKGQHAWAAPTAGQIRGPCSGLNAAANHGYLPRSGIATAQSISQGLWEAFSLALDATVFLETATRFFDGNPITGEWSIGPATTATDLPTSGLTGRTSGICGGPAHLKTEADASITRGDYLAPKQNSNCASYTNFVQELFDLADQMEPKTGYLTPRVYAQHSANRKKYSIENNPNYFAPPYAGVAFTFGAHMFATVLLSNHSAEYPRGFQTKENFLSLWGYTKNSKGQLVYTYGSERIPDNYYKRSPEDAWTLEDIVVSTAQQCASYPSNCQVGGNVGKTNSFVGIDPGDLTGGLINGYEQLSDPKKMACFISQNIQAETPSFLSNLYTGPLLKTALGLMNTQLIPVLGSLGSCPNLPKGKSVYGYGDKYPGAKME